MKQVESQCDQVFLFVNWQKAITFTWGVLVANVLKNHEINLKVENSSLSKSLDG